MTVKTEQLNLKSNFFNLTPEKILSSLETFGFRTTGRVLQLNSMENRVFEVEIEPQGEIKSPSDKFKIIKFYRPGRWSKEQLQDEHSFLTELFEKEISVVPPLRDPNGETIGFLDNEIYFACYEKKGGRNLDDPTPEQYRFLGRTLGRLHAIGKMRPATTRTRLVPTTAVNDATNVIFQSEAFFPELKESFSMLCKRFGALVSSWFEEAPYIRVHGDCHRGNILWVDERPTLVDFDDMLVAPAVQDLWLLLPGRGKISERPWGDLAEGYEQFSSFPINGARLIEPLRFLRLIRYAAWIAQRWHDPIFPRSFPHFGTPAYWNGLLFDLTDTLNVIESGGFFAIEEVN